LPRSVPESPCESLGPGSYMISAGTNIVSPLAELDGAFDKPGPNGQYTLSYHHILDGTSKTLLVGENNYGLDAYVWETCSAVNGTTRWGDQTWASGYWFNAWGHINWNIYELAGKTSYNHSDLQTDEIPYKQYYYRVFRSDHPGGAQFVFVDGSVHFIPETIDYPVLRALVTRAGGELEHSID
jgi:prepilin-type processing-associated H-X9-DG protein